MNAGEAQTAGGAANGVAATPTTNGSPGDAGHQEPVDGNGEGVGDGEHTDAGEPASDGTLGDQAGDIMEARMMETPDLGQPVIR